MPHNGPVDETEHRLRLADGRTLARLELGDPLNAHPWDFGLRDVQMPVSLWQGMADQILPAAMARHLAAALPACTARYLEGEGHLSLVARHIGEVLAELRS